MNVHILFCRVDYYSRLPKKRKSSKSKTSKTPSLGSSGRVQPRTDRPPDPEATSRLPEYFDVEGKRNHGSDGAEAQTPFAARTYRRRSHTERVIALSTTDDQHDDEDVYSDTTIADRHRNRRSRRTDVSSPVHGSPRLLPHQQRPPPPPQLAPNVWRCQLCWLCHLRQRRRVKPSGYMLEILSTTTTLRRAAKFVSLIRLWRLVAGDVRR